MKDLQQLKQQYKKLGKEIERLESEKTAMEYVEEFESKDMPKKWYIGYHGVVSMRNKSLGANGYLTKESAEQALAFRRLLNERDNIEGGYLEQKHGVEQWYIYCDKSGGVWVNCFSRTYIGGIPFSTKENAELMLERLGKDIIRTAFGVRG